MNKQRLYWAFQIVGWSLYAVFQVLGARMVSGETALFRYIPLITEALFFLIATHFFRNCIVRWQWLQLPMALLIPRVLGFAFVFGPVLYLPRLAVSLSVGLYRQEEELFANFLGNTFINMMVLFFWSVLYFIYHYFERYNLALKHEAALNEIELNQLKSQLNPHFIFNALNSIRALVDEDPLKSKKAITQLSNILRNSLVTGKKRLTRLDDEIRTVKDYLGLETIRFEERLRTVLDIAPDSLECLVPPLMIQTLVENGIKHGISQLKEGGTISIKTYCAPAGLQIEIRNSGQFTYPDERAQKSGGIGIENTKQRLKLIFGEDARFNISNENGNIVLTKLSIPQQAETHDESTYSRRRATGEERIGQFA